jgi:hypothetical protein
MNARDAEMTDDEAPLPNAVPVYIDGDVSAALFQRGLRLVGLQARIQEKTGAVIVSRRRPN